MGFKVFLRLMGPLLLFALLRGCVTSVFDGDGSSYAIGGCKSRIKSRLKDPDSFRFIDYTLTDETVTIKYKAKNSFNAYIVSEETCKR